MRILLLAASFAIVAPAQSVVIVGPGGFPEIDLGIAAAQPGDVVEVASGTYHGFHVDKALTIRAAPGAVVTVIGGIGEVNWLQPPPGAVATVARIQFLNPYQYWIGAELRVTSGTVWFEDCIFESSPGYQIPALGVYGATVVLRRCVAVGNGWVFNRPGMQNPGLQVVAGQVFATDSVFKGSHTAFDFSPAGVGFDAVGSLVQLVDCQIDGGSVVGPCWGTVPGIGMTVSGASDVSLADCTITGGASTCPVGAIGLQNTGGSPVRHARTVLLGGAAANGSGPAVVGPVAAVPLLGASGDTAPLVRGGAWQMDYRTEPNWPVGVFLGDRLGAHAEASIAGPVLLAPSLEVPLALLVADAQGAASYATSLPQVPALLGGTLYVEAISGVTLPLLTSPPVGGLVW